MIQGVSLCILFGNASVRKESWFPNRTVLLNYRPMEQSRWLAGRLRCRRSWISWWRKVITWMRKQCFAGLRHKLQGRSVWRQKMALLRLWNWFVTSGTIRKTIRSRMVADCLIIITCLLPCWSIFWNMPIHNPMFFRNCISRFLLPE